METVKEAISSVLTSMLPPSAARSIVATLPSFAAARVGTLDLASTQRLLGQIETGLKLFGGSTDRRALDAVRRRITGGSEPTPTQVVIRVRSDQDVLDAQRRCSEMVRAFFSGTDCVRLVTAVSELARNIYMYAGDGQVRMNLIEDANGVCFQVVAEDHGPGIANLDQILAGRFQSKTGLGRGLAGTRALLDDMQVRTGPGIGTTITGSKRVRRR